MPWKVEHHHYDIVGTTQEEAKKHSHFLTSSTIAAYSADEQTAGKGTQGRHWFSPPNVNLYVTFSLIVPGRVAQFSTLPHVIAVVVIQTLKDFSLTGQFKWVNDVLVNGKKIAGIYCESAARGEDTILHVGIGLNVNMDQESCNSIDQPVTSMMLELGQVELDRAKVFATLAANFAFTVELYLKKGFKAFTDDLSATMAYKNTTIKFDPIGNGSSQDFIQGELLGLDEKGYIRLFIENSEQRFMQGKIVRDNVIRRINTENTKLSMPTSGKKFILIYNDRGTVVNSVRGVLDSLRTVLDLTQYEIITANKELLMHAAWETHTDLLIFPGGRSKPFYQDLATKGNQKIKNYVENGGKYLGICAGGYYGCATTEFEMGYPLQVRCGGVLNFFPGIARGPAYGSGQFQYETNSGARLAVLENISLYYNGGASFIAEGKGHQVLARYQDLTEFPAAIVLCEVGKGKALLTGVHPEFSYREIETEVYPNDDLYNELKKLEAQRLQYFASLLHQLDIKI